MMNRSDKLRQLIGDNEAVFISSYPNIFYYSNFESEDAILIITKNEQLLFTDSRYTIQAKLQSPLYEICDISKIEEKIKSLSQNVLCIEEDFVTVSQFSKMQSYGKKLKPFSKSIKEIRKIKDSEEIKKIAMAEGLGDKAFSYVLDLIKPGKTEKEIAIELEFYMRKNGASGTSFDTICASGVRSSMPHGVAIDKVIEKGDFLTLDFGCVLDGYCSDMTRTVVVGEASSRQKEIYSVVLMAQKACLDMLKAGVSCADADKAARDIIKEYGYGEYFGHGTGHGVGVQVHELPNLSPKSDDILTVGNVVSVEPGIYIEGFGGVRIEDLVQIGDKNVLNLTKSEKDLLII